MELPINDLDQSQNTQNIDLNRKNGPLIVALTAFLNPDIIQKCKDAGFDDWSNNLSI